MANEAQNILIARQQLESSQQLASKPLEFQQSPLSPQQPLGQSPLGGPAQQQGFLSGFQQRQAIKGEQLKTQREIAAASQTFETTVAQGMPEMAKPAELDKAYRTAVTDLQAKIKSLDANITQLQLARQAYTGLDKSSIQSYDQRIAEAQLRRDGYQKALSGSKETVIRNFYSGAAKSMAWQGIQERNLARENLQKITDAAKEAQKITGQTIVVDPINLQKTINEINEAYQHPLTITQTVVPATKLAPINVGAETMPVIKPFPGITGSKPVEFNWGGPYAQGGQVVSDKLNINIPG